MRKFMPFVVAVAAAGSCAAVEVEVATARVGGFYADGSVQNDASFQNYFVGYGTSPGSDRTPERRSFFYFELPSTPAGLRIAAARLELRLPFGGLVFGKGPGVPGVDTILPDAFESFSIGHLDVPAALVLDPALDAASALAIFDAMDALPVASPAVFLPGTVLPDPGDGGPPIVTLALDDAGLALAGASAGGALLLSGWMPSWSEDLRADPSPPPLYFEASELIFGLTDVHDEPLLAPTLVLTLAPVPEPASTWLWGLALAGWSGWRWRRRPAPQRGTRGLGHPPM